MLVVRRTGQDVEWDDAVDVWWHDVVDTASTEHTPEAFDAEHPLYVMYTSGSTGKPKGILHTTGGYLTGASYTHHAVFDLKPDTDVYWCTADIGWVTGHSYIVYGPLANGVTQVLYEGTPDSPERGRWWQIVEKYGVTIFYTAPTAIRSFMKQGNEVPDRSDMSSLRILGSVGEPINPEAYIWYRKTIGGDRTPVVDTWWQTETGAIMISPLPGVTAGKPGSAMTAIPGISAEVVDEDGTPVPNGSGGYLVVTAPWPAMLRTLWGDDDRYVDTYWSRFKKAGLLLRRRRREEGRRRRHLGPRPGRRRHERLRPPALHHRDRVRAGLPPQGRRGRGRRRQGRGHRPGRLRVRHPPRNLQPTADSDNTEIVQELRKHVRKEIGPIATPRQIMVVAELPKTRSGKIMRRLLRDVAENREVGDVTTLADSSVMDLISKGMSSSSED